MKPKLVPLLSATILFAFAEAAMATDYFHYQFQPIPNDPQWTGDIFTSYAGGQRPDGGWNIERTNILYATITTPVGTLHWSDLNPAGFQGFTAYPNFLPPNSALYGGNFYLTQGYTQYEVNWTSISYNAGVPPNTFSGVKNGYWVYMGKANPQINNQPTGTATSVGGNVNLTPSVTGEAPLHFQWTFMGYPVFGATNPTLTLTNIQPSDAGGYQFIATNSFGSVTSSVAYVSITNYPVSFLTGASDLQYTNGQFNVSLGQLTGQGNIVIQTSSNLFDWTPIYTNPPAYGTLHYTDPTATNSLIRFYRALVQ